MLCINLFTSLLHFKTQKKKEKEKEEFLLHLHSITFEILIFLNSKYISQSLRNRLVVKETSL